MDAVVQMCAKYIVLLLREYLVTPLLMTFTLYTLNIYML